MDKEFRNIRFVIQFYGTCVFPVFILGGAFLMLPSIYCLKDRRPVNGIMASSKLSAVPG